MKFSKFTELVFAILTVLAASASMDAFAQPVSTAPMKGQGFAVLDKNGDGVISREEAGARPMLAKMFDKMDTNKDGVLSKDEMKVVREKIKERHMAKLDTDRDGRISRAEAATHPKLADRFDRIDSNGDGYLSKDELMAAREAHRARIAKIAK